MRSRASACRARASARRPRRRPGVLRSGRGAPRPARSCSRCCGPPSGREPTGRPGRDSMPRCPATPTSSSAGLHRSGRHRSLRSLSRIPPSAGSAAPASRGRGAASPERLPGGQQARRRGGSRSRRRAHHRGLAPGDGRQPRAAAGGVEPALGPHEAGAGRRSRRRTRCALAFLQAMFPESRFVVLTRHPIAVAIATSKWTRSSLPRMIEHWPRYYETPGRSSLRWVSARVRPATRTMPPAIELCRWSTEGRSDSMIFLTRRRSPPGTGGCGRWAPRVRSRGSANRPFRAI